MPDSPDLRPDRLACESHGVLEEVRLRGESLYKGVLLDVQRDWVRAPDGHEQSFEYTLHPGAAAIVPMLDDGRLVMERQWRYAMNRSFLEFPAGKLNAHEQPLVAAQRELAEETGYRARDWAVLGEVHPVIAYSTETLDDGRLVMERQWRYAMNRSFLEFPAGKLNAHEQPLAAAQRELAEETGYRARDWAVLGEVHPVIAYSTETIHLFMAKGLVAGPSAREQGECMELVMISPDDFFKAIYQGQVTDSKTLACALWLDRVLRNEWEVKWISQ